MFARFDENPAMTLQDIKETKRYGRTDARTDNVKTVYPPQTKFARGIKLDPLIELSGSVLGQQTQSSGRLSLFYWSNLCYGLRPWKGFRDTGILAKYLLG